MAIDTTYRLSAVGISQNAQHVNTFHFRQRADTPGVPPSQELIQWWINQMEDTYRGVFPSTWSLQEYNVYVSKGSPENLNYVRVVSGKLLAGGGPEASQLSAVVTWRTDIAGRRFRGRSYFGGWQTGCRQGQLISPFYASALEIFANRLITTTSNTSAFDYVVYSKVNQTTSRITGAAVRPGVYTQRRRTAAYGL